MSPGAAESVVAELQELGLPKVLAGVRADYLRRLFDPSHRGSLDLVDSLVTDALFAELEIGHEAPDEEDPAAAVADTLGHALSTTIYAARESFERTWELVELSAILFSMAGYTAKAFTQLYQYVGRIDAMATYSSPSEVDETKLYWLARAILADVIRRDFRSVADGGNRVGLLAESRRLSRDHSRFALVLAAICKQLDRIARERPRADDLTSLNAKLRVLSKIALQASDPLIFTTASRLSVAIQAFLRLSLTLTLSRLNLRFLPAYETELTSRGSRHPIFELWPPQAGALRDGMLRRGSWVLSLRTSAGKTLLAELKIAETLEQSPDALVVYVAPYTALATQVVDRLRERLEPAGLAEPRLWTGAYEIDASVASLGNLVVMTPEKFDAVLRGTLEGDPRSADMVGRLRLVVLDECHMLSAPGRGLTYEVLITRLKERFPHVELCAMSAVAGMPSRLAQWLTNSADHYTTSTWRPTRTRYLVYMRDGSVVDSEREQVANLESWTVAADAAAKVGIRLARGDDWPVFVLETRRDWAEAMAARTSELVRAAPWPVSERVLVARKTVADLARNELGDDAKLPTLLERGVAFHHGGLSIELRHEIEQLVRLRQLRLVASTTTLAEGVDLPFRSVLCPHLFFDREPMSRALFQNLSGRAGRAYTSIEGTVVFLEPEQPYARSYLFNQLLANADAPVQVVSQLPGVAREPRSIRDWSVQWRFQAQLLGVLADGSFGDEQANGLVRGSYAAATSSPRELFLIRSRAESFLRRWESTTPALAMAASPYRLTGFGQAACLGGLSADSALVVRRELLREASRLATWLQPAQWSGRLPDQLLGDIVRIALTPLEAVSRAIDLGNDEPGRLAVIRGWIEGSTGSFEEVIRSDRELLTQWVRGEDAKKLAAQAGKDRPRRGPLRKPHAADRIMDLNDYFSSFAPFLAWMYSAVLRIGAYLASEEEITFPDEAQLGIKVLGLGLDSWPAVFLADRFRIPRVAAARIARYLVDRQAVTEEAIVEMIGKTSLSELEALTGDPALAARVVESISGRTE